MKRKNIIHEKSFDFAILVVNTSKELVSNREYVLSNQLLRSGTSIGANVRESESAQSRKDFIHKLSISLKECGEVIYWIDLLHQTNYLSEEKFKDLSSKAHELFRILSSIVKTSKSRG